MDAIGRDRERNRVGNGVALVGMGVMRHFKLAFDARQRMLYVWPGASYLTLRRAGIEIDDRGDGPTVTRIVASEPTALDHLHMMDVIRKVSGLSVRDAQEARQAIAAVPVSQTWLAVERGGRMRRVLIGLQDGTREIEAPRPGGVI